MLWAVVLALYAVWFVWTMQDANNTDAWGWTAVAHWLFALSRLLLGRLFGLSFNIVFDSDALEQKGVARVAAGNKRFVGAASPHGQIPLTQIGFGMFEFKLDRVLSTFNIRIGGASVLFFIPLIRELVLLLNVRSVSRESIVRSLKGGFSVALNPGGIYEMVHTSHEQEQIFVQNRLGFIRLAMEAGVPLLCMYSFGENQVFHAHTFALKQRRWVAKRLRVGIPLPTGRFGVPLLPLPTKVTLVVGNAVDVGPPNPAPSDAEVDAVFRAYVAEMGRIFKEHGRRFLPPDVAERGLRIERIGRGLVEHFHVGDQPSSVKARATD